MGVTPRTKSKSRAGVWVGVGVGLAVCLLAVAGYFVWPSRTTAPEHADAAQPSEEAVGALLQERLPGFLRLGGVQLQSLAPYATGDVNGYKATFAASVIPVSGLYEQSGTENDIVLLREAVTEGATVPLTGFRNSSSHHNGRMDWRSVARSDAARKPQASRRV